MTHVHIQSQESRDLLDIIDSLRSQGLGGYVNLPQIIVCGDQSSGKSSVLEAISGLSFPTKDNLCTRFATELILRRDPVVKVDVSILPHHSRTEAEKAKLASFTAKLDPDNFDIGPVIENAKIAMGLDDGLPNGTVNGLDVAIESGKRFSDDVLRIQLSGPTQPHLTLVDLPGLFQAGNSEQSTEEAPIVEKLVLDYMESSRSIILAAVSAATDFANQSVTRHSRRVDPHGLRTVGLITKPDRLDEGSDTERSYVKTALNEDVVLKLGWHVLKNREFKQRHFSSAERNANEREFFEKPGSVWAAVDPTCLGIDNLRDRLSSILRDQIVQQLPSLIGEIEAKLADCTQRLEKLGTSRLTALEQRQYLSRVSSKFTRLMKDAVDGNYTDASFFGSVVVSMAATTPHDLPEDDYDDDDEPAYAEEELVYAEEESVDAEEESVDAEQESIDGAYQRRLRAVVQNHLTVFRKTLHDKGHTRKITDFATKNLATTSLGPLPITRDAYIGEVKTIISKSRGRELPGLFNPLVISDLFREQSKKWAELTEGCVATVLGASFATIRAALNASAVADIVDMVFNLYINPAMEKLKLDMKRKALMLNNPQTDGHPITYNHYLTENVQKARNDRLLKRTESLTAELSDSDHYPGGYIRGLIESAVAAVNEPNMEKVAASDAIDYMEAYYKVALKRYTDDVAILVVEQGLISKLPGLFTPDMIYDITDEDVARIAKESEASVVERQRLTAKSELFRKGIQDLSRVNMHNFASHAE
ncbi:interferon-induced gtp-binding protein mx [Ophiostoma piceae UAMH 11346]|uniref:Interferon-induced gtp-binding protein mx n=1 Tax=Ophiostoma piceae (strain UAMH 11346) TaxID=1262450 RepID=S3CRQ6_OPHP1|nr:interferon-induced gtp-binding protein mx [Ophiostoma piceae UAMH 11346]